MTPTEPYDPTAQSRRRVKAPMPDAVDVAIIGAGLGGLMSGALLAQAGARVVVLDQHYVAGGCCTMFSRVRDGGRYNFDVGLHYIGECGPEGRIRKVLQRAGIELEVEPMDPDGYDTLIVPGARLRVPVGRDRYRERLVEMFPAERAGIDRYVRFLAEVEHMQRAAEARRSGLSLAWDLLTQGRLVARYQSATLAEVLDSCTQDPVLRALLAGQNGDYGLPPSRVSALLHAGLANHYFGGAWYPKGGGQVIADRLAQVIEDAGGAVLLRRRVERVLVEGGRAVGVRVRPHQGEAQELRAKVVISNADLLHTLQELIPPEALPSEWQQQAQRFEMAGAIFLTCLAVRDDLDARGFGRTNYWAFDTLDFEQVYADLGREVVRAGCAYITSATMKDPGTHDHAPAGLHTVEVMSLAPGRPEFWGADPATVRRGGYRQAPLYRERKQELEDQLIQRLDTLFPGLAQRIVFRESATPLTQARYTFAAGGTGYGLAGTPAQFMRRRPGYRGPIPGMFLCGANTRAGHGVSGALQSGAHAARRVAEALELTLNA